MIALPAALPIESALRPMWAVRPIPTLAALGAVEPTPPAATAPPAAPASTVPVVPVEPIAALPTVTLPRTTPRRVGAALGGRTRSLAWGLRRGARRFGRGGFAARGFRRG
ncbi:MAG: hypothetical protein FJ361_05540 [Gemmatimonadetes bacterium]|nr:hypothetical protein [Gemmatimonadota bacterium]